MGTSRQTTERQIAEAKEAVQLRAKELEALAAAKGQGAAKVDDDPVWRHLHARARQLGARLRKIAEVEATNALVEQAKIDNAARRAAEKQEAKVSKKAKPAKEGKDKAKGEAKPEKKKEKSDKPAAKGKK